MSSDERPARAAPPQSALFTGAARPERAQAPPSHLQHHHQQHYQPPPSFTSSAPSYSSDGRPPLRAAPYGSTTSDSTTVRVQFTESSQANLLAGSDPDALVPSSLAPGFSGTDFKRKKSLVRPDRERIDENHRLYNYRAHAARMEAEGRGVAAVSRTGHYATAGLVPEGLHPNAGYSNSTNLRRGRSILAREEGMANETGLSMFKRGATLRRPTNKSSHGSTTTAMPGGAYDKARAAKAQKQKQPLGPWMLFCLAITICCPSPLLKCFGEPSRSHSITLSYTGAREERRWG